MNLRREAQTLSRPELSFRQKDPRCLTADLQSKKE